MRQRRNPSITKGQRKILKHAIKVLKGAKPVVKEDTNTKGEDPVTTASLAKDSGLNALLQSLESDGGLDGQWHYVPKVDHQTSSKPGASASGHRSSCVPWTAQNKQR